MCVHLHGVLEQVQQIVIQITTMIVKMGQEAVGGVEGKLKRSTRKFLEVIRIFHIFMGGVMDLSMYISVKYSLKYTLKINLTFHCMLIIQSISQ